MLKHSYAEILSALTEGKQVQIRLSSETLSTRGEMGEVICATGRSGKWFDACPESVFFYLAGSKAGEEAGVMLRIKPEALSINGREFRAPLTNFPYPQQARSYPKKPEHTYWSISCGEACSFLYDNSRPDYKMLEAGLAFATKEACEAFLVAVKSVLRPQDSSL